MSSSYQNTIFINLPVSDIDKSIAFYTAIGFVQMKAFSSSTAAMMSLPPTPSSTGQAAHEGAIKIMLLAHSFYRDVIPPGTEPGDPRKVASSIICLSRESREAIDDIAEKAARAGGEKDVREMSEAEKRMEEMGIYGRVLRDPDGHILETVYMPPESYVGKE